MSQTKNRCDLTLTLYPNMIGLGYLITESPKDIVDYGIARIRPLSACAYVKRLKKYVKRFRPTIVILKGEDGDYTISRRIKKVIRRFTDIADEMEIPVHKYSRKQIKEVFASFGASNKYQISKTVASWYPELKRILPNPRKNCDAENYHMGVFDCFALMLTHHYIYD